MRTLMLSIHVFGAVIWVGGLAFVSWALLPAARAKEGRALLAAALGRFQWVARACSLAMLLSGGHLIATSYPVRTWFSTQPGFAAFLMMVLWLVLTAVLEMSARPRKALAGGGGDVGRLSAYYHAAMAVGVLLLLDAAWAFVR